MSDPEPQRASGPAAFHQYPAGTAIGGRCLTPQDTPNRQVILITDGLPTAHFEGSNLPALSARPADGRGHDARGRPLSAGRITINIFLLPTWSQSCEDVQFAYRLAESKGRVFFTAGKDLDRYVLWDYLKRRRKSWRK